MGDKYIKVVCTACGKEFLFAGKVPDGICLDCFVEKYGEVDEQTIEIEY